MLTGALVGAVVGVVVFLIRSVLAGGAAETLKKALAAKKTSGVDAARAVIDAKLKAPYGQRFAALTLIEDRATLEREAAALDPVKQGYAKGVALLGLVALGDACRVQELADHAAVFDRDAPKMWGRMKKAVNGMAAIGRVLGGAPSTELDKLRPDEIGLMEAWMKTMLWDLVSRAYERDGRSDLVKNVRMRLQHLDAARAA